MSTVIFVVVVLAMLYGSFKLLTRKRVRRIASEDKAAREAARVPVTDKCPCGKKRCPHKGKQHPHSNVAKSFHGETVFTPRGRRHRKP